jgi:hypothetical protein
MRKARKQPIVAVRRRGPKMLGSGERAVARDQSRRLVPVTTISTSWLPHAKQTSRCRQSGTGIPAHVSVLARPGRARPDARNSDTKRSNEHPLQRHRPASWADLAGFLPPLSARRVVSAWWLPAVVHIVSAAGGALLPPTQIGEVEPRYLRSNGRAASSFIGEGHREERLAHSSGMPALRRPSRNSGTTSGGANEVA